MMSQSTWTRTHRNNWKVAARGASPATISILHPHAPFPTVQQRKSNSAASTSKSSSTFSRNLRSEAHPHESRTSPADQWAKSNRVFSTLLPPLGIRHPNGTGVQSGGRPTWTFSGGAHRWAGCAESVILDLSGVGSAQVLGPLLTRNTHKPSRLPGLWNRAPPQVAEDPPDHLPTRHLSSSIKVFLKSGLWEV